MKAKNALLGVFAASLSIFASAQDTGYRDCLSALNYDPEFLPIREKVALGLIASQNFTILTNQDRVKDSEKQAVSSWVLHRRQCLSQNETSLRNGMPSGAFEIIAALQQKFELSAADLYTGAKTYGEFAQQRARDSTETSEKIQALGRMAGAEQRQAQASNDQARRDVIMQMLNQPRPQPYQITPYQMPTPITTNCTRIGNQVQCRTD